MPRSSMVNNGAPGQPAPQVRVAFQHDPPGYQAEAGGYRLGFDQRSVTDLGDAWTEQAVVDQLAVGGDAIAVGTAVNVFVRVAVDVLDRAPADDSTDFDHVVEGSIEVRSGRLVVMGCTDYEPDAVRFAVPAGWLRGPGCEVEPGICDPA
jgi:hypothetical protein